MTFKLHGGMTPRWQNGPCLTKPRVVTARNEQTRGSLGDEGLTSNVRQSSPFVNDNRFPERSIIIGETPEGAPPSRCLVVHSASFSVKYNSITAGEERADAERSTAYPTPENGLVNVEEYIRSKHVQHNRCKSKFQAGGTHGRFGSDHGSVTTAKGRTTGRVDKSYIGWISSGK